MKRLSELRATLTEHGPDHRGPHLFTPGYSPPNILILKRKTVRAYSSTERVALYYNDKLQRYFSVPFSVGRDDSRDDVVGVSESEQLEEISLPTATRAFHARQELGDKAKKNKQYRAAIYHYAKATKTLDRRAKKYQKVDRGEVVEGVVTEDAISHLKKVKEFHTNTPLYHNDGTHTRVDPTTAHALLTVHAALHPDNQKKMSDSLEHSKAKFHKILDFAWGQVRSNDK